MPSSVLIILVAVVILIAVVVYGGLRYLRSDDEEEFDGTAAERGSGRGRADRAPAQGRTRRDHDDFGAERDLPRPAARSGAPRDPRARREAEPRRDQRTERERTERGGYYDDDRTEVVPAGGRATRIQAAGSRGAAGSDTAPGRSRVSSREFDRDSFDRDSFDRDSADYGRDIGDRRDGRAVRTAPAVREVAVADLDALDRRGAAKPASKPDGRRNGHGPRDEQDDLLPAVKPRQSQGKSKSKSKKDDDGEWPSNEWDELSDVDYWTELAADKPFTADAPPPAARPGKTERTPARGSGPQDVTQRLDQPLLPPVGRVPGRAARDRSADLAARDRSADLAAGDRSADLAAGDRSDDLTATGPRGSASSRTRRLDAVRPDAERLEADRLSAGRSLPRRPDVARSEPVRSDPARPESRPARPAPARPAAASLAASSSRHAAPLDDDPLTSPSFPRIEATDSRSYGHSRSGTHERPAVRPAAEYAAAPTSYDQPTAAYAMPAADSFRAASGSHSGSLPDSYLKPAASGSSRATGAYPAEPAAQYPPAQYQAAQYPAAQYPAAQYPATQYPAAQHSSAPAEYSYPAGGSAPAGGAADGGHEISGYGYAPPVPSYQAPAADPGGYGSPGDFERSQAAHQNAVQSGYGNGSSDYGPGSFGYGNGPAGYGNGSSGYENGQARYETGSSGYGSSGYNSSGYGTAGYDTASYEPGGFGPEHYDSGSAGYGTGPASYGTAGQPAPAAEPDPLGYADYAGQVQSGGYASPRAAYADPAAPGGYAASQHAEPGYAPSYQAGEAYPYPPGVPEPYATPAVPDNGAPTAAYHYKPSSGQPGHPGEAGGYAGADPYAVDPYGYSGYGNRS